MIGLRNRAGMWVAAVTLALLAGCGTPEEPAGPMTWLTDLPKAMQQAKAEKKLVLIDFTGSDWCQPCMLLKKNVLATKKFQEYADKKLVLVEVDFPQSHPLPDSLKLANQALAEKYKVQGYPTVILMDAEGKELNRSLGYDGSKPAAYIENLEKAAK